MLTKVESIILRVFVWIFLAKLVAHLSPALAQDETAGELEIHSVQFYPQIIHENQPFVVEVSGLNVAGFDRTVAADSRLYFLEVDGNELLLTTQGPLECGTPIIPLPNSGLPQRRTFALSGLPEGEYTFNLFHTLYCGAYSASYEVPLRIYGSDQETKSLLEAPAESQTVSGVGLIRGWACYPKQDNLPYEGPSIGSIEYSVDMGERVPMGLGMIREDTAVVCGEGNERSGYGAVVYWGAFGEGQHTFELFIDGEFEAQHQFNIAAPVEGFLTGIESTYSLPDFLSPGRTSIISWSQSDQNFIITEFD